MNLTTKRYIIGFLGLTFLASLVFVQFMEVARKQEEAGLGEHPVAIPENSRKCVECHAQNTPGIVDQWKGSTHAVKGIGCLECHRAGREEPDAFDHYGQIIATVVTPRDCARCHPVQQGEFASSHHAAAGQILHSLDNYLAESVEGARVPFNPHGSTPGRNVGMVNGLASAFTGCLQCHGSLVGLKATDGGVITVEDLQPGPDGMPTNLDAVARIVHDGNGKPVFHPSTWPNTGIGRINLDGSLGSCTACHSRHDFSPRRARQPENCGKCHLGPDHPQKEIYEESKHGVAYRDLKDHMNLDSEKWILGKDYTQAPTCATCHMSGNINNGGKVTHDPGERLSWTNRPPVSLAMDTDINHKVVKETDPEKRAALTADTWRDKRGRMQNVCKVCHSPDYISAFYQQYDDFVILYNEKFGKPGAAIMKAFKENGLLTKAPFDEQIEWTWFYLWHHEGRRARHGASMMAPDYAHWHGMFEVGEDFYQKLLPEAEEILDKARADGKTVQADAVQAVIDEVLARPEHSWMGKELSESGPRNFPRLSGEGKGGK